MQRTAKAISSVARQAAVRGSLQVARPIIHPFALNSRSYASGSGLSHDQIQQRVVEILKTFEKVNPEKVTASSSFTNDLGLDSLDAVEVVMAIEEEFAVEISDADADKITTVKEAIDYIAKTPEAH